MFSLLAHTELYEKECFAAYADSWTTSRFVLRMVQNVGIMRFPCGLYSKLIILRHSETQTGFKEATQVTAA